MPPTVLVRVSHPIFHQAVDSTPMALRPVDSGASLASPGADADSALAPEGKLGSLQVCSLGVLTSFLECPPCASVS